MVGGGETAVVREAEEGGRGMIEGREFGNGMYHNRDARRTALSTWNCFSQNVIANKENDDYGHGDRDEDEANISNDEFESVDEEGVCDEDQITLESKKTSQRPMWNHALSP